MIYVFSVLYFFNLEKINFVSLLKGMVDSQQCSKPVCTASQTPSINNCNPDDGYQRKYLYRSWNSSCTPLLADLNTSYVYPWSYSATWNYGISATVRCLPGYALPSSILSVSKKLSQR